MPSLQSVKRKINSVKKTQKITKAMKMVAAAKLKRAQQRILAFRPYGLRMRQAITDLSVRANRTAHPLLQKRPAKNVRVDDYPALERLNTEPAVVVDPKSGLVSVAWTDIRAAPLDDAGRAKFRTRFRELFEGDPSRKGLYRDVSNGIPAAGVEYYLPLVKYNG